MFSAHALRDGRALRVHECDDLYQICSEGAPARTEWLYNAVWLYYVGFADTSCLVCQLAWKKNLSSYSSVIISNMATTFLELGNHCM